MRVLSVIVLFLLFAPLGRSQEIPKPERTTKELLDTPLEELTNLKVTSASLHDQSLKDAPASVTVITAEDIRRRGCQTVAEALAFVRGSYLTYDYTYWSFGLRGFGVPGDYDVLVLIQINGHTILDNVDEMGAWYGQDFPLDVSLIQRIEIVRGSSSALYGSNGIFATINIVTKAPQSLSGEEVRVETGSQGEKKVQATMATPLGQSANLLFSASMFYDGGASALDFPQFAQPGANGGRAVHMDGQKGYHAFADLTWGNWELIAVAGDRVKTQPITWGDAVFNDPGTRAEDSRNFIELSHTRAWNEDRVLRWRVSYDNYRYRGIYHYLQPDAIIEDNREREYGDWITTGMSYRMPAPWSGALTVGSELKVDLRTFMNVYDIQPERKLILNVNKKDINAGFFGQQEWSLGRYWKLDAGVRFDWSRYRQSAVSPRGALIFQPTSKSSYKFMVGRGFRNPSAYEMFFDDNGISSKENPSLRPSTAMTYEFTVEHRLATRVQASVSAYRYVLRDMITATYTDEGLQQYQNLGRANAAGIEMEMNGKLVRGLEVLGSFAFQRAVAEDRSVLPNSPGQVGKLCLSVPLFGDRASLSPGLQYAGERRTSAGAVLPWMLVPELTFNSRKLVRSLEFSLAVRNLANQRHNDPVALTPAADTVPLPGRTFLVSVVWRPSGR